MATPNRPNPVQLASAALDLGGPATPVPPKRTPTFRVIRSSQKAKTATPEVPDKPVIATPEPVVPAVVLAPEPLPESEPDIPAQVESVKTARPQKGKKGRPRAPATPPPAVAPSLRCVFEFAVYLDNKVVGSRSRIVDLHTPHEDQEPTYSDWKDWYKKKVADECRDIDAIPKAPRQWNASYGPQNSRKTLDIEDFDDWKALFDVLISTQSGKAGLTVKVDIRYGLKFPPNTADSEKLNRRGLAKKPSIKRLLSEEEVEVEVEAPKPKKKGRTSTDKMRNELAERTEAEKGTPSEYMVEIKRRWSCEDDNCASPLCWLNQAGEHHPMGERDIQIWAKAILKWPKTVTVEDISAEVRADLVLKKREKAKSKVKAQPQFQQYQQPQFPPQFNPYVPPYPPQQYYMPPPPQYYMPPPPLPQYYMPQYLPAPIPPSIPPKVEPEPELPPLRSPVLPQPSVKTDPREIKLAIRPSSPIPEEIGLQAVVDAFWEWLKPQLRVYRRDAVLGILERIKEEEWSLEEVRALTKEEQDQFKFKAGPFKAIVSNITPFKEVYKKRGFRIGASKNTPLNSSPPLSTNPGLLEPLFKGPKEGDSDTQDSDSEEEDEPNTQWSDILI